jgi:hypothetical protein
MIRVFVALLLFMTPLWAQPAKQPVEEVLAKARHAGVLKTLSAAVAFENADRRWGDKRGLLRFVVEIKPQRLRVRSETLSPHGHDVRGVSFGVRHSGQLETVQLAWTNLGAGKTEVAATGRVEGTTLLLKTTSRDGRVREVKRKVRAGAVPLPLVFLLVRLHEHFPSGGLEFPLLGEELMDEGEYVLRVSLPPKGLPEWVKGKVTHVSLLPKGNPPRRASAFLIGADPGSKNRILAYKPRSDWLRALSPKEIAQRVVLFTKRSRAFPALSALKAIAAAQSVFRGSISEGTYAPNLKALGEAKLLFPDLASGTKDGYRFDMCRASSDPKAAWMATASPAEGKARHFAVNHMGVIYESTEAFALDRGECKIAGGKPVR